MTMIYELHESTISRLIEQALFEDLGFGDITTESIIPEDHLSTAHILINNEGVVAGLEVAELVYRYIDMQISFSHLAGEGDRVKTGQTIAHIHGPVRGMLQGKQTVVNFLMRMSGIATLTRLYVDAVQGTETSITGTRYTIPTLRMIDHFAVKAGGGMIRSFGTDEEIFISSEHVDAIGSIRNALEKALAYREQYNNNKSVSVEVRTFDELRDILPYADRLERISLFGFPAAVIPQAVDAIGDRTKIEVAGNITPKNAYEIANSGVQYIRVPELTHSPQTITFTFRVSI